jgi:hypothetical protein
MDPQPAGELCGPSRVSEQSSSWRKFWRDRPGQRFTHRYQRLRGNGDGLASRVLRAAVGVVLVLLGLIFMPLPGPGFVPLLAGAAVLAGLSLRIATWLDRAEVRVRRWIGR